MSESASFPPSYNAVKEQRKAYYQDCLERIRSGMPVWMQRNFEADLGRVLDYYKDGVHQGFVDEEYGICDAYLLPLPGVSEQHGIVAERTSFEEATQSLVDAVEARQ